MRNRVIGIQSGGDGSIPVVIGQDCLLRAVVLFPGTAKDATLPQQTANFAINSNPSESECIVANRFNVELNIQLRKGTYYVNILNTASTVEGYAVVQLLLDDLPADQLA